MDSGAGIHKIKTIRAWYIFYRITADVVFAAAIALLAGTILFYVFAYSALCAIPIFAFCLALFFFSRRCWAISYSSVAFFLDNTYPELEESSSLVLKPANELYLLERLQAEKVEDRLRSIPVQHKKFTSRLLIAITLLIVATLANVLAGRGSLFNYTGPLYFDKPAVFLKKETAPEKILPQIEALKVMIAPPAYTGRPRREQDKFNISAEDGSGVSWWIKTNVAVQQVYLLFNDKEKVLLRASDGNKQWMVQKGVTASGFYQVVINNKASDLYQLMVIKDQPPIIQIKKPGQYTYIDAGEIPKVNIDADVSDDYGVSNAVIMATVAKGSGEAVKFKEVKIDFPTVFASDLPQYRLQKLIDLPALGLEPGDELYFYILATDTHQQQARTDAYTISIQDTAKLLAMDGVLTGSNIKPEFFRSERQIIMDSEKLLKDRDSVAKEKFNGRSNDLGVDQKLLRLRYGKFLGEEEESTIGAEAAESTELSKLENFNNAAMVKDAYTDKHDNAEVAGFLEPEIKEQLKATLTEMWKAELQLRLNKPETALAFEYKALRLLKDLQQKSRAFVAKTSYHPAPLKPEKRLSGDLLAITPPNNKQDIKPDNDQYDALKTSLPVLEQLKTTGRLTGDDSRKLQLANQQLSAKASTAPGVYLPALNAMRRILSSAIKAKDVDVVERAIQKTLQTPGNTPQPSPGAADMGLSSSYYHNLKSNTRN